MPKKITVRDARALLRSRDEMLADGRTERDLRARVDAGEVRRVRRGWYVDAAEWGDLWNEGRHLVEVVAVALNSGGSEPSVFCGASAAVVIGLPLYGKVPKRVHTVILGSRHTRSVAGVMQHDVDLPTTDIVEIDGIRCTSPDRTVLDLACTMTPESGLAVADAALRAEAVTGHVQDADAAARWHERLAGRAERVSIRGIRRARETLALADGRAQLPGESVSRMHLHRLGFRDVLLQVHVIGATGKEYWLDFGFPRSRAFGEFDGMGKYVDAEMRGDRSVQQVVLDEKWREDDVRGVTGWRSARWGVTHIRTIERFSARLQAFDIHP